MSLVYAGSPLGTHVEQIQNGGDEKGLWGEGAAAEGEGRKGLSHSLEIRGEREGSPGWK